MPLQEQEKSVERQRQNVICERRGHILIITIDRPEARNAVDYETSLQMEAALDALDADPDLRVGIITGSNKTFSAGADLKAAAKGESSITERRGGFGAFARPSLKPTIAAVEGFAVGGGFELCLSCDLVVAARGAKFGLPEVRHNVVAVGGALFRLPRRIPYNVAMEMAITGHFRNAEDLYALGFVNRLAEEGQALSVALSFAEEVLANGPTAVWASREIMFQSNNWTDEAAWSEQWKIARVALDSEDAKEGLRAFAEKRKPQWKGR
jgi:enoyl-CoA hydratase